MTQKAADENMVVVALCADSNVAIGLVAVVSGVLTFLRKGWMAKIYVLDFGLQSWQVRRLYALIKRCNNGELVLVSQLDRFGLSCLPIQDHFSVAAYGRLLLPQVIHEEKVLYFDCDLMIKRDVVELWQQDIGSSLIAVAPDILFPKIREAYPLTAGFAENAGEVVFNSGVILFRIDEIKKNGVDKELLDFAIKNRNLLSYLDQEVLNIVFSGKKKLLDVTWNFGSGWWQIGQTDCVPRELKQRNFNFPAIFHLTGAFKPWNGGFRHPALVPFIKILYSTKYFGPMDWIKQMPLLILPPRLQKLFMFR